jgi:hypothetical protein
MKTYKQWEIPNKSKVKLEDGTIVTFLKMDGMYAKWDVNGEVQTGNFEKFIKEGDMFVVV